MKKKKYIYIYIYSHSQPYMCDTFLGCESVKGNKKKNCCLLRPFPCLAVKVSKVTRTFAAIFGPFLTNTAASTAHKNSEKTVNCNTIVQSMHESFAFDPLIITWSYTSPNCMNRNSFLFLFQQLSCNIWQKWKLEHTEVLSK
jgi:hypothetical protein